MKSNKSPKLSQRSSVSSKPSAPASDGLENQRYPVDEIFDFQGDLGWEQMVDRIRRGGRIRGRSM